MKMDSVRAKMPYFTPEGFYQVIMKHMHLFEKMCPDSEGFSFGIDPVYQNDKVFRLMIEPYFISTFNLEKQEYFTTSSKSTIKKIHKVYDHFFNCKDCITGGCSKKHEEQDKNEERQNHCNKKDAKGLKQD